MHPPVQLGKDAPVLYVLSVTLRQVQVLEAHTVCSPRLQLQPAPLRTWLGKFHPLHPGPQESNLHHEYFVPQISLFHINSGTSFFFNSLV